MIHIDFHQVSIFALTHETNCFSNKVWLDSKVESQFSFKIRGFYRKLLKILPSITTEFFSSKIRGMKNYICNSV